MGLEYSVLTGFNEADENNWDKMDETHSTYRSGIQKF